MLIERTHRWPTIHLWVLSLVTCYLGLVGLNAWLGTQGDAEAMRLCLFRRATGYPCPTCGSTRMVLAIGRGRLLEAVRWNPLVFGLAIVGVGLLLLRVGFSRRVVWARSAPGGRRWGIAIAVVCLANWLYLLARM